MNTVTTKPYELYRNQEQNVGKLITGLDLEVHLRESGLITRALSLESPLIKGWLADPLTYPEELKRKRVTLWGSMRGPEDDRFVAVLFWKIDRVFTDLCDTGEPLFVHWVWLKGNWGAFDPALLASS